MSYEKLPLRSKLAYGGLGGGIGLPSQIAFSAITFFYNTTLGLSTELTGFANVACITFSTSVDFIWSCLSYSEEGFWKIFTAIPT